ncbi:MAG: hypothetical protein NWE89_12090 [Candidatus Bathyarchaeota archaeon]|nr:hypothetical protein [Candidatus Bathyarchaeota archaeon]
MPTLKCLKGDRALLRKLRNREGRKEKDIVHDAVTLYAKTKVHKRHAKAHEKFLKTREEEDKEKAEEQTRSINEAKLKAAEEELAKAVKEAA